MIINRLLVNESKLEREQGRYSCGLQVAEGPSYKREIMTRGALVSLSISILVLWSMKIQSEQARWFFVIAAAVVSRPEWQFCPDW